MIAIYNIKVAFISFQGHAFSLSLKIDVNLSLYRFNHKRWHGVLIAEFNIHLINVLGFLCDDVTIFDKQEVWMWCGANF